MIFREAITLIGGIGGIGKSVLLLSLAICAAIGVDKLGLAQGHKIKPRGILLINNEDSWDELELRMQAALRALQLTPEELRLLQTNLHYQSGIHSKLKIAYTDPVTRAVLQHQACTEISVFCRDNAIDILLCDPLVSLHDVDENNNIQMEGVMEILRKVCADRRMGCVLLHHLTKSSEDAPIDAQLRGATAIVNAARKVIVLSRMSTKIAKNYALMDGDYINHFQILSGKSNYSSQGQDGGTWFKLRSIQLPAVDEDGEELIEYVGIPIPADLQERGSEVDQEYMASDFLEWLDDEEWPITLTDHYGKLCKHMSNASEKTVRRKMEVFPLINSENKLSALLCGLGGSYYRVWREKRNKTSPITIHREDVHE
jgi:hypothetical protein